MELTEYGKDGKRMRTLPIDEVKARAAAGDKIAARELLKLDWPTLTIEQKVERLKELL